MKNHRQSMRSPAAALLCLAVFGLLAGCTPTYTDYAAFMVEPRPLVSATEYRMAPPDVIMIQSKRVREINGHREAIRPDGRINLPLLGPVFVTGKTCEEVGAELEMMAHGYYEDADVNVNIVAYRSKQVYVFGEVSRPGTYSYDGRNTVLGMMAAAQPTRLANPAKVQVLRPDDEGKLIKRMTVDLNKMVKAGDVTLNALLEEGDIIYVPANPFAAVGLAFQQVLLPFSPISQTVQGPVDVDSAAGDYNTINDD
jgi:polysaccharide export outer membrane protein